VPEWKVQVLDATGHPLSGVQVNEEWIDPIEDGIVSAAEGKTDKGGWVVFPSRSTRTRLDIRVLDHLTRHGLLPRGKYYLPSGHVFVCWQNQTGELDWDPWNHNLDHQLVLHYGSCPHG